MPSIKLEGSLSIRGVADDGAITLVNIKLEDVAPHLLDGDLSVFLDILGTNIRNAMSRTHAMLVAGL